MTTAAPDAHAVGTREVRDASLLLVDKPAGMTSHDVVAVARRTLRERRIGHHGTLDPFATGLLVLLVGRATRLAPWIEGEPKVYRATISFGSETDTHDLTGNVVREAPLPDAEAIDSAILGLQGRIMQLPPKFSAKKVGGVKAYEAARRGEELELAPVPVTIYEWDIESRSPGELVARITCSGGTYIRALARDLGVNSGSAAHLTGLRRLAAGPLAVTDSVTVDELRDGNAPLVSPLVAMGLLHRVELSEEELTHVVHGRAIDADGRAMAVHPAAEGLPARSGHAAAEVASLDGSAGSVEDTVPEGGPDPAASRAALVAPDGTLAAVADLRNGRWMPRVVVFGTGGNSGA